MLQREAKQKRVAVQRERPQVVVFLDMQGKVACFAYVPFVTLTTIRIYNFELCKAFPTSLTHQVHTSKLLNPMPRLIFPRN